MCVCVLCARVCNGLIFRDEFLLRSPFVNLDSFFYCYRTFFFWQTTSGTKPTAARRWADALRSVLQYLALVGLKRREIFRLFFHFISEWNLESWKPKKCLFPTKCVACQKSPPVVPSHDMPRYSRHITEDSLWLRFQFSRSYPDILCVHWKYLISAYRSAAGRKKVLEQCTAMMMIEKKTEREKNLISQPS